MLINAEKQSFSLVCSYVQVALHKGLTSIRWCCCWCRGRLWSVMLISKIYLRPPYDTQAVQCSRTHLQGTFSPSFRSRNLEGGSERHFWYSECKNRLRQPRGHIHFLLSNGFQKLYPRHFELSANKMRLRFTCEGLVDYALPQVIPPASCLLLSPKPLSCLRDLGSTRGGYVSLGMKDPIPHHPWRLHRTAVPELLCCLLHFLLRATGPTNPLGSVSLCL